MTSETPCPKLQLGVVLGSHIQPAWVYRILKDIQSSTFATITRCILDDTLPPKDLLVPPRIFQLYNKLENILFNPSPDALENTDVSELLRNIPTLAPSEEHQVDLLINFGGNPIDASILQLSKHGAWLYQHGERQTHPKIPAGMWEVFHQNPVTESCIRQVSRGENDDMVIRRSLSATNFSSVRRNRNSLFWNSLSMLPHALEQLYRKGPDAFFEECRERNIGNEDDSMLYKPSLGNVKFLRLALSHILRNIKRLFLKRVVREQWTLLVQDNNTFPPSPGKMNVLKPPRERFWADPFVVSHNDKHYIFFEDCHENPEFGHISVIERDQQGNFSDPKPALERPYHLSYPCVFEWEDNFYMIPESSANHSVELYRCENFPLEWTFIKNIFNDIQAVDATVFQHDGKWWMFANSIENDEASLLNDLYLYYTDSPVNGTWTPHPENPVVSDVRRARPAGIPFTHDGSLYRPAQDCSKAYGYAVHFNRITKLTPTEYCEKPDSSLIPDWDAQAKGTHTYNSVDGLTVIDAKFQKIR